MTPLTLALILSITSGAAIAIGLEFARKQKDVFGKVFGAIMLAIGVIMASMAVMLVTGVV